MHSPKPTAKKEPSRPAPRASFAFLLLVVALLASQEPQNDHRETLLPTEPQAQRIPGPVDSLHEAFPPIRKGEQRDRFVGRGWAPWAFMERESAKRGRLDAEYARDKVRRYIKPFGENAVRFNGWRTEWGDEGISFHIYYEPYASLCRELLALLKAEGITAIVSISQFDMPSRYERGGGVENVVGNSTYERVIRTLMETKRQPREEARLHASGAIMAFAPWIPGVYSDLMRAVRKMRSICPPGTIAELFNERPAPWELSPFIKEEVQKMAEIFPSVRKAFADTDALTPGSKKSFKETAKAGYAQMFQDFHAIWGRQEKTIQGFIFLSDYIDPNSWGYSAHPYPVDAHLKNVRTNPEWLARFKTPDGKLGLVDSICEIGVTDTIPYWDSARAVREWGKWKIELRAGEWVTADKPKLLKEVCDSAMDVIQVSTGKPPKVLIGWEGHTAGAGLDPRIWDYTQHISLMQSRTQRVYDMGYRCLSVRPEMRRAWAEVVKNFWERGNPSAEIYLPDSGPQMHHTIPQNGTK